MRKKFLEKRLARLQGRKQELEKKGLASSDAAEVREINAELERLNERIEEIQDELDMLNEDGASDGEQRQQIPEGAELRGGNPLASYHLGMGEGTQERSTDPSPYGTMEYRTAFMAYVQRGTPIPENLLVRAGGDTGTTVTTDIGAIIPETIMNDFIREVSKVYGNIYAKVRKLNVQGGVKYPISKLKATVKWITETTVSDRQKAGEIKEFVEFSFHIAEIRVAQSLLSQVVSLPLFESEITRIMVEAYVEAMDKGIVSGDGNGKLLGITKDTRVLENTANIIEMSELEFDDWISWRKKLFAKIPLSKRGRGEFLFAASTVESYLLTMRDANDRPLFREATDLSVGNTAGSFFGRNVDLVEPDVIADYDTADDGDIVGIFWVPGDYAINTNQQFGMKRWFDEDKNEWVNKGLTIVDGKLLDISGCYLIKKKAKK